MPCLEEADHDSQRILDANVVPKDDRPDRIRRHQITGCLVGRELPMLREGFLLDRRVRRRSLEWPG
jgi:hypothetical protein